MSSVFSTGSSKKHHRFSKSKIAHMFPPMNLTFMLDFPGEPIFPRFSRSNSPHLSEPACPVGSKSTKGPTISPADPPLGNVTLCFTLRLRQVDPVDFSQKNVPKSLDSLWDSFGILHRLIWISMWYGYKCVTIWL